MRPGFRITEQLVAADYLGGHQDDHFPDESQASFLSAAYQMSSDSDRTGTSLEGTVIRSLLDIPASIRPEGVIAGSVYNSGDGKVD